VHPYEYVKKENDMNRKKILLVSAAMLVLAAALLVVVSSVPVIRQMGGSIDVPSIIPRGLVPGEKTGKLAKFGSDEEFRKYFSEARESQAGGFVGIGSAMPMEVSVMSSDMMGSPKAMSSVAESGRGGSDSRVSGTNVQVAGIDEPDIVKTDGSSIYFSREPDYRVFDSPMPMMEKSAATGTEVSMLAPGEIGTAPEIYAPKGKTDIIAALPADTLAKIGSLGRSGEMLLFGGTLVVFDSSRRDIVAYDISDKASPKEKWIMKQGDGTDLVAARKYENALYLVEKTWVNESQPCPIMPLSIGSERMSIPCTDIYRPSVPSGADAIFTALSVDVETGTAKEKTSFVGSAGQSTVYMSENAIYATYPKMGDPIRYLLGFFRENSGLLPNGTLERLEKLSGYDIGREAKMTEFSQIMAKLSLGQDADAQLKFQNEMRNRMTEYAKEHLRELESTGIAKLSLPDLSVSANGSVPGSLLNQFSLDEYQGNLRVATTVGGQSASLFGWGGGREASANDVYVLDADLDQEGELLDLGLGERIYAARFIGETGYLVTFRETDPFYVLDLSDPDEPRKAGELKIPGYSSYLHPLGKDMILGVGKEEDKVKLSLFDVSSPDDPREISKYVLDEYWSEAVHNHHAFLADPEYETFFIPGSKGGYVFSHKGDELTLVKAAKDDRIKRALFIGDVFYIVSEDAVYSFDQKTWEKIDELEL
jgi:uncharacterized secreted protein with C-terminal beta-propeller domain